jgi:hypothetical protein
VRDDTDRTHQSVGLGRFVELGEERAAVHVCDLPLRVNANSTHRREVDHDPVVAGREPRNAVAAAPDCHLELPLAREAKSTSHAVGADWSDDDRRAAVEHLVPDGASPVVSGVAGEYDLAGERRAE